MKLRKETKRRVSGEKRARHGKWYDDACGTAFALELIGERWSLLIVRELMFGGRRFGELRGGLPGISAKVLTERLESLEAAGIVLRRQLPPPASAQIYELTPWGYGAEVAIRELGRWAATSPRHDPTLPLSPASLMLSLRAMFVPERAGGMALSGVIRIGVERFFVRVVDGVFTAGRGEIDAPDFVVTAPEAPPIAALIHGKFPARELAHMGLLVEGDGAGLQRFVDLFLLPEKLYPPVSVEGSSAASR
jgi:DNA-binding HxlR family transcriptional regulator